MINSHKFKLIDFVVLITVATVLFPVLTNQLPSGLGSFRFLWGPLISLIIVITKPIVLTKKPLLHLLIYVLLNLLILLNFLWVNMSDWNKNQLLNEGYNLLVTVLILSYYFYSNRLNVLTRICKISILFIYITAITTYIALIIEPSIIRNAAANYLGNQRQIRLSERLGSAGYSYVQSFILLIPLLIYQIKKKRDIILSHVGIWSMLGLIVIITLMSQVFANMLVMFIAIILAMAGTKRRKAVYRYLIIIIVLVFFIPKNFYIDILETSSSFFSQETNTYMKINDMAYFLSSPEILNSTETGARIERYPLLLMAFMAEPFLGDASYESIFSIEVGGHLYWMNKLTIFGIFGFLVFLIFLYKVYQFIDNKIFDKEDKFYYFLSFLLFILFGLMKNTGGREIWMMLLFIIPGLYIGSQKENEYIKQNDNTINEISKKNRDLN